LNSSSPSIGDTILISNASVVLLNNDKRYLSVMENCLFKLNPKSESFTEKLIPGLSKDMIQENINFLS
jgi:hypothetical protein